MKQIKSLKFYLATLTEDTPPTAADRTQNGAAAANMMQQNMTPSQKQKSDTAKRNLKPTDGVMLSTGEEGEVVSKNGNQTTVKTKKGGTKNVDDSELIVPVTEDLDSNLHFPRQ